MDFGYAISSAEEDRDKCVLRHCSSSVEVELVNHGMQLALVHVLLSAFQANAFQVLKDDITLPIAVEDVVRALHFLVRISGNDSSSRKLQELWLWHHHVDHAHVVVFCFDSFGFETRYRCGRHNAVFLHQLRDLWATKLKAHGAKRDTEFVKRQHAIVVEVKKQKLVSSAKMHENSAREAAVWDFTYSFFDLLFLLVCKNHSVLVLRLPCHSGWLLPILWCGLWWWLLWWLLWSELHTFWTSGVR
jgi:hypothetical protein